MNVQKTDIQDRRVEATLSLLPENIRTVLDVGCREGKLSNTLCDRLDMVVGIDIDRTQLTNVKAACCQADMYHLPFKKSSFDLVLCTEVLEHLNPDSEHLALNELSRVARQYILITVPWRQRLLPAMVRCPDCKSVFHVSGHIREFFSKRDVPTPHGFRLNTFAPMVPLERAPQLTALVRLAHCLGTYMAPPSPPAYCETCHEYVTADSAFPLAGRIAWAVRNRMSRIVRLMRPTFIEGWAAWLFEKVPGSPDSGGSDWQA